MTQTQNYDSQIDASDLRKTFYTQCVQLRKTTLLNFTFQCLTAVVSFCFSACFASALLLLLLPLLVLPLLDRVQGLVVLGQDTTAVFMAPVRSLL